MASPKHILIIQSRTRPEIIKSEQDEYRRACGECTLDFLSALSKEVAWENPREVLKGYDAVIIGGSGEFDLDGGREEKDVARVTARETQERLTPLLQHLVETDTPTLGICFGHQLVGNVFGGEVSHDLQQAKSGTHEVSITETGAADALLVGFPKRFMAQYGHKDSITRTPQGATVLARGEHCMFSILRYGPRVYTCQFHPELTAADVRRRLAATPGYLPEGVLIDEIVHESTEASQLIPAFLALFSERG